jgi:bidirectional [NiFe] hydrogenase diaphorase subunit
MHGLLTKIQRGAAAPRDLDLLSGLCDMVKQCSLCGLGQSAPNPVISTMRYFRSEYDSKIKGAS